MATTPIFTATPVIGMVQIATANANRDGSGELGTVITAGPSGTRISRITIQAIDTTTAGMVRLYISDGTNIRLWREIPIAAITPSATVQAFVYTLELTEDRALVLPPGYSLQASTEKAEAINVVAEGGNF